jgi:MinD-like ATPase involved in chromosome partitioning or flagellar assembly
MMVERLISQKIDDLLTRTLRVKDPHVKVHIRRNSLGWLQLRLVTACFYDKAMDDREQQIDDILAELHLSLGQYPFASYDLLTPREAAAQPPVMPVQLPLWSEILMAPEPESPIPFEEDTTRRPFVATFYSFKGGVGRTTALGFVASILAARGRRVLMIDFDLEAPGLSFMFPSVSADANRYGILDYIHQRFLTPQDQQPAISDCIHQIPLPSRGELYILPAGEYDEGYIHRLADLDIRLLYQRDNNPIHQLLDDVKDHLDPDFILIDARTGFTEMGAVALFDRADLGIICFSPTDQSFAGLRWVVEAASKQRKYHGIPDLRFLLTPMPPVDPGQQEAWLARVADWIAETWGIPPAMTVAELYYVVSYNPAITTLESLVYNIPPGLLEPYVPVADAISTSLPERKPSLIFKVSDSRASILRELAFRAATAQEMESKDIPTIFQRTGDFPTFLDDRTWLVRGAKGTGKSLLFRLFVERSEDARTFASPHADLQDVSFLPGHGPSGLRNTLLVSTDLTSYEQQAGDTSWQLFWINYAILQLGSAHQELLALPNLDPKLVSLCRQPEPQHRDIIQWLVNRTQLPEAAPQASDELRAVDRWLQARGQRMWLLYDELDVGFGQDYERRRRALEALFVWWIEVHPGLKNITAKILLREDIWDDLNFTNKAHYAGRFVQLRWAEDDLWRLVLRQVLHTSKTLAAILREKFGVDIERLDSIEAGQLQKVLYPLWGERMGRGNKAYTHNWIRNRITDTQDNRFPRSLILLLQKAVELERNYTERNPYESVLRPRALIEALPFVSEQRVDEVRNEYPEFDQYLAKLQNQRSPIALEQLGETWGVQGSELNNLVNGMLKAGIIQEYLRQRQPRTEKPRYSVAELYLYGLHMTRLGQR